MSVRQILRNVVLIVTRTRQFIKSNRPQLKHFRCEQIRERGGARKKDWEKVGKAEKRVCLISTTLLPRFFARNVELILCSFGDRGKGDEEGKDGKEGGEMRRRSWRRSTRIRTRSGRGSGSPDSGEEE